MRAEDARRRGRSAHPHLRRVRGGRARGRTRRIAREWLTFVVVGGGPTGVEISGQLAILARHTMKRDFRRIDPSDTRVILLDAGRARGGGLHRADLREGGEGSWRARRDGAGARDGDRHRRTRRDGQGRRRDRADRDPDRSVGGRRAGPPASPGIVAAPTGADDRSRRSRIEVNPDLDASRASGDLRDRRRGEA